MQLLLEEHGPGSVPAAGGGGRGAEGRQQTRRVSFSSAQMFDKKTYVILLTNTIICPSIGCCSLAQDLRQQEISSTSD